jgi:hypothetical protein
LNVVKVRNALFLLLGLLTALLAVSNDSLWIDELGTAIIARPPTLHGCWTVLRQINNSNLQLPVYMLYIWGWARVAGISTLALRIANIPWFFLGLWAIWHFLRRHPRLRALFLVLYCVHPFVWYYVNEARPYAMQLAGALLAYGAFFEALDEPEEPLPGSWWWLFLFGLFLLCGVGMLGVPWAAALLLCLLFARKDFLKSAFRNGLSALLVFAPAFIALGGYYAWTLEIGAGPADSGMRLASIPFAFYEQLGFMGLGPGRVEIREHGFPGFISFLPAICALGLPLGYALARGAGVCFGLPPARRRAIFLAVLIPTAFTFSVGYLRHFLVLARHLMPLFPFILAALTVSLSRIWERGRPLGRALAVLAIVMLTVSSLEIRFAYRHRRDDYRDAAADAIAALRHGEKVWWAADSGALDYYNIPATSDPPEPGQAWMLWNVPQTQLETQPLPDLIVYTKPDLFDRAGTLAAYIAQHHYHQAASYPAITTWRK